MIRPATEADVPEILHLIRELAEFEDLADQVACTEDDLRRDLFGPDAVVHVSLPLNEDTTVAGYALWYRTFSTFLGQTGIWLEDLYVRPAFRRQGHATAMMADLRARTGGRVEWDVLEWNAKAIDFYQGLGARPVAGWTKYRWLAEPIG